MPCLEFPFCDLCDLDQTEPVVQVARDRWFELPGEFSIVRCCHCGLVYLNPRPDEEGIGSYYPKEYSPHSAPHIGSLSSLLTRVWRVFQGLCKADLCLLEGVSAGRLLDVGCGSGRYMKLMKEKGWDVYGVEVSRNAAGQAEALGLEVFAGRLCEAQFPPQTFDAVVMTHSLEHMHRPSATLREVHKVMTDEGILLVEVPNLRSVEARVFGKHWYHLDVPRHLYHFSLGTLKLLLKRNGFCLTQVGYNPSPVSMARSISYMAGNRLDKILVHPLLGYIAYALLPASFLLAMCGSGASMVVAARKA